MSAGARTLGFTNNDSTAAASSANIHRTLGETPQDNYHLSENQGIRKQQVPSISASKYSTINEGYRPSVNYRSHAKMSIVSEYDSQSFAVPQYYIRPGPGIYETKDGVGKKTVISKFRNSPCYVISRATTAKRCRSKQEHAAGEEFFHQMELASNDDKP